MFTWLKKQKEQVLSPFLDWVQIEVTTHCNAACTYCPHTLAREGWPSAHFPLSLFYNLLHSLHHTNMLFLQGWGEPLLNPDLFEMVSLCKKQKKIVGFTSNGMLLNPETIHSIVDLQVDILAVSFAGTTPATHNRIRKGTDFDTVVAALEYLNHIKTERKTTKPAIHLAYIMLASNFDELDRITGLAEKVGAEQVVASNLTLICNQQLSGEALFNNARLLNGYSRSLARIKRKAADSNILFAYRGPGLKEISLSCPENVAQACVINAAGEVSPCVFTNPVLSRSDDSDKQMLSIFQGRPIPLETFSFGNIKNDGLTGIWKKKRYREFREIFDPETILSPREIMAGMPPSCKTCYKRLVSS